MKRTKLVTHIGSFSRKLYMTDHMVRYSYAIHYNARFSHSQEDRTVVSAPDSEGVTPRVKRSV